MSNINEFLEFCPTDTGTNLVSQVDYLASGSRTSGVSAGVASSKLNNKSIRQANFIASQVAQYISDSRAVDVLDDALTAKFLAQINGTFGFMSPVFTPYTSGSGTHSLTYYFFVATANATSGATYTNNGITFTVSATISSGVRLTAKGTGAPLASGTLTKTGGTGDATITFYAVRAPISLSIKMAGGGGGGGGSGNGGGGTGGTGSSSTFGSNTCAGGVGGTNIDGGVGGAPTLASGFIGISVSGGAGSPALVIASTSFAIGGTGGSSALGGAGKCGQTNASLPGSAGQTNTGGGGGGASIGGAGGTEQVGAGGGSGAYIGATIVSPAASYSYAVGGGGTAGTAGSGGQVGGAGGSGVIIVSEFYN